MSAAAECFWRERRSRRQDTKDGTGTHHQWKEFHPKGPEAEDNDDKVDGVGQEHEDVDISDGTVLWLDQSPEEVQYWSVEARPPEPQHVSNCH